MTILAHLNSLAIAILKHQKHLQHFIIINRDLNGRRFEHLYRCNSQKHLEKWPQWPKVCRGRTGSRCQARILQCTRLCGPSVGHSHLDLQLNSSNNCHYSIWSNEKCQNVVTFVVKWGSLATSVGATDGGVGIAVGPRVEQCSWPRVSNQPKNRQSKMGHNP